MSKVFLDALENENNRKKTWNGAEALSSTKSSCLDAFGTIGSMRFMPEQNIINVFYKAWSEDRALATKMLFWLRDIRGIGAGERKIFRILLRELASKYPKIIIDNLDNIPYYGRYDDLFCLLNTRVHKEVIKYIKETLYTDIENIMNDKAPTLLAKWMPSENTSSEETKKLARLFIKELDLTPKKYRKMLSKLRKYISIVEAKMSKGEWDEIDYSKVPSKASLNYKKAFYRHNPEEYLSYLTDVATGKTNINASTLYPDEIVSPFTSYYIKYNGDDLDIAVRDALWNSLPNYFEEAGTEETAICVVDVSGSMIGKPMDVAVALGLYCADKCNGVFKNNFITFSENPKLQKIKGENIFEKCKSIVNSEWGYNTNIESVFDLILNTAIKNNMEDKDIPKKIYIISDMQFDAANRRRKCDETFIETMRNKFTENGYTFPQLVYWNVNGRDPVFHQSKDETGFCMVSGYSPSLFKAVLLGTELEEEIIDGEVVTTQKLDPMTVMLNTLNNERYDRVIVS